MGATTRYEPLSQVRKTLKVKWYRSPIEREKLAEVMRRSSLRGAWQTLGHLGLWLATGLLTFYLFKQQIWWGFAAALFAHGTIGSFFKGLAAHELGHGTVFKSKKINRNFLRIISVIGWWNYHEYAMSHTYHHRYTLHPEGDREVVLPRNPTLWAIALIQLFTVNIGHRMEANPIYHTIRRLVVAAFNRYDDEWIKALYEGQPEARRQAVNWARFVLLCQAAAITTFIAVGEPILAVIFCGHMFIGNWLKYFVGVPMHCGLRDNVPDFRKCVRTIHLNPFFEFLYWHMNWHTEHHMFAGVPCYHLAKLHEIVKDDMPEPRSLVGAWREMRDTWRRQQKDPDYQFDTPLPTTARPAVAPATWTADYALETSIGDLAPEALSN